MKTNLWTDWFSPSFWDVRDQSPILKFMGSLHPELKTWPKHPTSIFTPPPTQIIHPSWFMPNHCPRCWSHSNRHEGWMCKGTEGEMCIKKMLSRSAWKEQAQYIWKNVGVGEELKEADGEGLVPSGLILKATEKQWWFKGGSDRIQCKPLAAALGKSRNRCVKAKAESLITSSES